ncbi:transposase-like protein [Clostridium pascui]|uniref:transposase-like zinc-binding domain-containing protein n=1 Tax=Clostridium pascui TaxID=46609 RepID=UPI00195A45AF|nr:IS1 family transposase [Clostridium pascui]MBM7872031.1 transposase-like protein [Clostridium pascui]
MSGANSIIKFLSTLNKSEQEKVYNYLEKELILGSMTTEIQDEIKENRFSLGRVCPYCKKDRVLRNGKYNNKQRYICKDCHKTLTDFTYSPYYNSKKDFTAWLSYIKCMIAGYSIRKCAEIVEISYATQTI